MHGPSPRLYCSSSMRALTGSLVQIEPHGTSPDINMTPAPLIPVTSALISQRRLVSTSARIPFRDEQGEDPEPTLAAHRAAPRARTTVRSPAERGFDEAPLSTTGCSRDYSGVRATGDWGNSQAGRSFERPPEATLAPRRWLGRRAARPLSGRPPAARRHQMGGPSARSSGVSRGNTAGDEPHRLRPVGRGRPAGFVRANVVRGLGTLDPTGRPRGRDVVLRRDSRQERPRDPQERGVHPAPLDSPSRSAWPQRGRSVVPRTTTSDQRSADLEPVESVRGPAGMMSAVADDSRQEPA